MGGTGVLSEGGIGGGSDGYRKGDIPSGEKKGTCSGVGGFGGFESA